MSQQDHSRPPPYTPPTYAHYSSQEKGHGHSEASAPPPPGLHATPPTNNNVPKQGPTPIIIYNTTVATMQFGPYPQRVTCPRCNAEVMTETHSTPGLLTYVLNGVLFLVCCPCFLVPCCVRECKDIEHRCPNCQHMLGVYKRI